ncbi:MAG: signal peptidase I [Epsilonproteobacteria bacterium]|nr:signal peptidase I [Campylobacterota bacterium]
MKFLKALHRFSSTWTGTIIIVLFLIFFVVQSFVIPSGSMKRTMHEGDFLFAKKFAYGTPIPTLPWLEIPLVPDFNNNGHLIEGDKPQREDIVIFRYPKDNKVHYVKRCVATGGDELLYTNKHLLIHFAEGDEYIKKNYPANKILTLRGKLWVDNPYMEKYPGIQYVPKGEHSIFKLLLSQEHMADMSATYVQELGAPVYNVQGRPMNALYKKVEKDHYYMIGDNRDNSNDSRFWGSVSYSLIVGQPWVIYFSWDSDTKKVRWDRVGRAVNTMQFDEPTY